MNDDDHLHVRAGGGVGDGWVISGMMYVCIYNNMYSRRIPAVIGYVDWMIEEREQRNLLRRGRRSEVRLFKYNLS